MAAHKIRNSDTLFYTLSANALSMFLPSQTLTEKGSDPPIHLSTSNRLHHNLKKLDSNENKLRPRLP